MYLYCIDFDPLFESKAREVFERLDAELFANNIGYVTITDFWLQPDTEHFRLQFSNLFVEGISMEAEYYLRQCARGLHLVRELKRHKTITAGTPVILLGGPNYLRAEWAHFMRRPDTVCSNFPTHSDPNGELRPVILNGNRYQQVFALTDVTSRYTFARDHELEIGQLTLVNELDRDSRSLAKQIAALVTATAPA